MELILISYPEFFKGEADLLRRLLEKYEFTFHLRKPGVSELEYIEFIRQMPKELHSKIVIHSAYKKLEGFKLKGVHYPSTGRPDTIKRSNGKILSTSCHSIEEVKLLTEEFTHCFLSPVFPSISKPGHNNVLERKELRTFLEKERNVKVIGLGGINHQRLKDFTGYLFDGYAVLGAVWGDNPEMEKNIENNFVKIYECLMSDHTV